MDEQMKAKLNTLAELITAQQKARLIAQRLINSAENPVNYQATVYTRSKYAGIDIGLEHHRSGRYMVELSTGRIYGIKAYGHVNKAYYFGTLDTIGEFNWGGYYAVKVRS